MSIADDNPYQDPMTSGSQRPESRSHRHRRMWPTVALAVLLFVLAAQRVWVSFAMALLVVPVQAILLVFTFLFRRRQEQAARRRIMRTSVYVLALAAATGVAFAEERSIERQARELVTACEAFERDRGHLPNALSELVPDYRPSIPSSLGRFLFLSGAVYFYAPPTETSSARFLYRLNPDASRSYSFETHQWYPP